jgi:nickel transport protein
MRSLRYVLVASIVFATSLAAAHDLWLERDADGYALYHGHRHSGHAGDELIPYAPGYVQAAICVDAVGARTALAVAAAYPAQFAAECVALLVEASSGAWSTTSEGTINLPAEGRTGVVRSWRSFESIKRIDAWHDAARGPMGEGLELVPIANPLALQLGDKMRLLVTLRGQPQAGVTVAYAGEPRGVTGAGGQINVRIRKTGTQWISASLSEPSPEPGVARWVHATALQFEAGAKSH